MNTSSPVTYLFFDTETTGLPRRRDAPVTDLSNWPRLVQLGYLLTDTQGSPIARGDFIIRPEGFTIPVSSTQIHGITNDRALREGHPLKSVMNHFHVLVNKAAYLVAHNMAFDEKIIGAEFLRNGLTNPIPGKARICTMQRTINFCAIPGPYGYKWPSLQDLHRKLFGTSFTGAHNAATDIQMTCKCFWELRRRGMI